MHALVRCERLDQVRCPHEKLAGGAQLHITPAGEIHGVWVKHAVEVEEEKLLDYRLIPRSCCCVF